MVHFNLKILFHLINVFNCSNVNRKSIPAIGISKGKLIQFRLKIYYTFNCSLYKFQTVIHPKLTNFLTLPEYIIML